MIMSHSSCNVRGGINTTIPRYHDTAIPTILDLIKHKQSSIHRTSVNPESHAHTELTYSVPLLAILILIQISRLSGESGSRNSARGQVM